VRKKSTEVGAASSPTWETLEAFARQSMQDLLDRRPLELRAEDTSAVCLPPVFAHGAPAASYLPRVSREMGSTPTGIPGVAVVPSGQQA
jgi:hypothetical protein